MANILYTFFYCPPEDRKLWDEMVDVCRKSFEENLGGEWEFRLDVLDEKMEQKDIFFDFFKRLHAMWQDGHNVLYINSDMVCVKPTEIFGKYDKLTLFWKTEPPRTKEFPLVQFNGGIMYVPKETTKKVWDFGFKKYAEYMSQPQVPWATDQSVFNHMLYKQGFPPEHYMDNRLHYLDKTPELNELPKSEAHIIHYFGTRGRRAALKAMKEDYRG